MVYVLALVLLLLCFAFGHAHLVPGDACLMDDGGLGECRTIASCPGISRRLNRGLIPAICSFENNRPIVCCPTDLAVTKMPARWPTAARRPVSLVDSNTIAGRKCVEYAQHVYIEMASPTLAIGEENYKVPDCAMVAETQIAGGDEAVPKEFPHMVALGYETGNKTEWNCGGTLISERFVLTAGHCLSANGVNVSWVRLGDLNLYSDADDTQPVTLAVAERIKHEEYHPPAHYNDIALLKLERDVTFSAYIRPACLYSRPGNPPRKLKATATGWGKVEWNEAASSDILMKVDLQLRIPEKCNRTYRYEIRKTKNLLRGVTPESMICAGDPKGKKDTCAGDSGAPLQIRLVEPDPFCMYSIIGLTSFGAVTCGEGDRPAVYTRVSHFIPWIERHVWP